MDSTKKLDYFKECNEHGVPIDDFKLAFCDRCFQKDCTRSRRGTSRFENRVGQWEERMFNAPILPKNDPRYSAIIAKKFLSLAMSPAPNVRSEWVDPVTEPEKKEEPLVAPPLPEPIPEPVPVVTPPSVAEISPPVDPPAAPVLPALEVPVQPASAPKRGQPKPIPLMNTPYSEPRTLGNQPVAEPRDAWAPEPLKPGERVVNPGARIKIQKAES